MVAFALAALFLSAAARVFVGAVPTNAAAPDASPPSSVATLFGARDVDVVTPLSAGALATLVPYIQFARAAYCPKGAATWSCGPACDANKDFVVTRAGGNGDSVQYYYVGYWAAHNTVIVGHEGTDPTRLLADLTDIRLLQGWLSPSLFPGAGLSPLVHVGFRDEHARTARTILAEVTALMGAANTTKVAVVGHSLGGALAELDAVYLALNLPRTLAAAGTEVGLNVSVRAVTFGKPRVGNAAWAALVDKHVNMTRVNNKKDVVPIVPPRALNYLHPRGEVHLLGPGDAVACPGNDDADDPQCQIKSVPSVFNGSVMDHLGPYEGIMIGTTSCVGPA